MSFLFDVTEAFRGIESGQVEVFAAKGESSCGFDFQLGLQYLVYANHSQGFLVTGLCHQTKLLTSATRDLEYIRSFGSRFSATVPPPAYIHGTVANRLSDLYLFSTATWPVRGVTVQAWRGDQLEAKTVTDKSGQYEFSNLPSGEYQIRVSGPGRYDPKTPERLSIGPDSCVRTVFQQVSRSVLKGRLLDSEGDPDTSSELRLVPVGMGPTAPSAGHDELEGDVDDDASFRFEVPAGRYRLAAKPLGETVLVYHPRTLVLADAAAPGPKLRETKVFFRLPKRPVQLIKGTVVDHLGRAAPRATVGLHGTGPDGSHAWGKVITGKRGEFVFQVLPDDYEIWADSDTCVGVKGPVVPVHKGQQEKVIVSLPLPTPGCPAGGSHTPGPIPRAFPNPD